MSARRLRALSVGLIAGGLVLAGLSAFVQVLLTSGEHDGDLAQWAYILLEAVRDAGAVAVAAGIVAVVWFLVVRKDALRDD